MAGRPRDMRPPTDTGPAYLNEAALDPSPESSWGKLLALVPEGSRVLDVGCGHGAFAAALSRLKRCTVVGIEPVTEAAANARTRCAAVHEGAVEDVLRRGDLPADFDVVVASDVLEHLVDTAGVLRQLAGRLRPGGALLASIPNVTHLSVVLALAAGRFPRSREGLLDSTHLRFFGERDVLELFSSAGYAVRVRDRVVVEPRFTEFRTDLSRVPIEVVEFLQRNPHACTYQFIVRAVPSGWATPEDHQAEGPEAVAAPHGGAVGLPTASDSPPEHAERLPSATPLAPSRIRQRLAARARPASYRGLRVLYVTDRSDAPFRYRCLHACEQLRISGAVANVANLGDKTLLDEAGRYSVVVLFRLPWSPRVEALVDSARAAGATVAFDVDDLVFDPAVEEDMPFLRHMDPEEVERHRRSFAALSRTLRATDFCIAPTEAIARRAAALGVPAFVHPNLLSRGQVRLARAIRPLRPVLERPLLGYFSGSNTHDGDLRSVAEPLARFLEARRDFSFLLGGFAALPERLAPLAHRVARFPFMDHLAYPWLLARCRAVIAPIERISELAHGESGLKVFEPGILGVPAVASPTESHRQAVEHGVSGFVATSPQDWAGALLALADRTTAVRLGRAARALALEEHTHDAWRDVLAARLAERAGRASGASPGDRPLAAERGSGRERLRSAVRVARESLQCALGRPPRPGGIWTPRVRSLGSRAAPARVVAAAGRDGERVVLEGRRLGWVLADRERPIARLAADAGLLVAASGATDGIAAHVRTPGAGFELRTDEWDLGRVRYLLVQMRARTATPEAFVRLLWRYDEQQGFSARCAVRFLASTDGATRTYLVPLRWRRPPRRTHSLRFEPLDRPGAVELPLIALLERSAHAAWHRVRDQDLRQALAKRFLSGLGIEIGALENPLPLPAGASARNVDRLTEQARRHNPQFEGRQLVSPSVKAEGDGLTLLPAASHDFVVASHVLEHLRDPIRALREWIRVLRPGGHLYVSVLNQDDPLDRLRPVTGFDHLLADHAIRSRVAEDREHYLEWARGSRPELAEAEQRAQAEELAARDYHYHTFDRPSFERLLSHVCPEAGANVVELQAHGRGDATEHVAVVRRVLEPRFGADIGVDVVVPVYNAREHTSRCVESVLRHATGDWRLVLVDDCSTEPGLAEDLAAFASRDSRVVVLRNDKNLGFTATANRGMREARGRDVLLLNSDTEVYQGFLDQLRAAAHADETTGILSPFSNNATICSIPEFARENPIPEGFEPADFARLVWACSTRSRPDIVTAVGFCMYVKAAVLERVGLFDEVTFGRGYGEENDLCERARKAGFRIQLCDDVFVYHKGKASFAGEGHDAENGPNAARLEAKHPGYHAAVERFVRTNPLAPLHDVLRFHLRRLGRGGATAVAFLIHASPFTTNAGGTEHFARDLVAGLRLPRAVLLFPSPAGVGAAEVIGGDAEHPILYDFPVNRRAGPSDGGAFVQEVRRLARVLRIRATHVHHLMSWPLGLPLALAQDGVPYALSHHDYFAVCPNWNLYDHAARRPCDCVMDSARPDPGCLPAFYRMLGDAPPAGDLGELRRAHRAAFAELLGSTRVNVFPSAWTRDLVLRHFPATRVRAEVIEHGLDTALTAERRPPGERLRVAVAGAVAEPAKGADRYLELLASTRALPVEWHFFGDVRPFGFQSRLEALRLGARLVLHGRYPRAQLPNLLAAHGIDLCAILPDVHETFSFVLSEALIAGVPVLATRRGALSERVAREEAGWLVEGPGEAAAVIADLCAERSRLDGPTARARGYRHRSVAEAAAAYRALYADLGWLPEPGPRASAQPEPEHLRELYARSGSAPAPWGAPEDDAVPSWLVRSGLYHRVRRLKRLFPSWMWRLGREAIRPAGRARLRAGFRRTFSARRG